uniref:Uncharacterized protein n=1 Tax=Anguilla anguilla TaxID=7936 RepID=A0A0E9X4C2_ANGAN
MYLSPQPLTSKSAKPQRTVDYNSVVLYIPNTLRNKLCTITLPEPLVQMLLTEYTISSNLDWYLDYLILQQSLNPVKHFDSKASPDSFIHVLKSSVGGLLLCMGLRNKWVQIRGPDKFLTKQFSGLTNTLFPTNGKYSLSSNKS